MEFVAAWREREPLALEGLLAITRPLLVEGAVRLCGDVFPEFDARSAADIRLGAHGKYMREGRMTLPPTAGSHRFAPWMPGYTLAFKGFAGTRRGMQRYDQLRLFQAADDPARKPGARRYRDHIWEVTVRVDWSPEPDRGQITGVRAGLFGDAPSAHPGLTGYVYQVFRHIDLCGAEDPRKPERGRCTRVPRDNVAGDGRGFFVGWEFEPEAFDDDETLLKELQAACQVAWGGMQRALAFPPPD